MHEADSVDYGPLRVLIGTWSGNRGVDVAPEPDGEAETGYHETTTVEIFGREFRHTDRNELRREG